MAVTYVTGSGKLYSPGGSGSPLKNRRIVIEADTADGMLRSVADEIVFAGKLVSKTDAAGNLTVSLPALPQAGLEPSGAQWKMTFPSDLNIQPVYFQAAASFTWASVISVAATSFSETVIGQMNEVKSLIDESSAAIDLIRVRIALRPTLESLAKRTTKLTRIACIDDSVGEGVLVGAPAYVNRWMGLAQSQLRARLGVTGGVGFMPAYYADGIMTDETTRGGTAPTEQSWIWGPGGKALLMPGTTGSPATLTWPAVTCDKIRVYYGKTNFLGGQSKVFVDNVDVTNTGTLGGNGTSGASGANLQHSNATKAGGFYWELSVTPGTHTLKIQSTVNGSNAIIEGAEFFNGDATAGLHIMDATHSGARADHYIDAAMDPAWQDFTTWAPDLTVVGLGINDASYTTADVIQANMTALLAKIRAAAPNGQILVVHRWRPGAVTQATWDAVGAAKKAAVATDSNAVYWDMARHWPAFTTDGALNNGLMVESTNPVHTNTAGNQRMADILTAVLAPF